MSFVYHPRTTRYVDVAGKRVSKDFPGARKITRKSKKWHGCFRDPDGVTHRVPLGCTDKSAAQTKLNELIRDAERRCVGLTNPAEEHLARPIKEHLVDFKQHLSAQDNTDKYVNEVCGKLERVMEGCVVKRLRDISLEKIEFYLAEQRRLGKSLQTNNHNVRAIKRFSRWLVRSKRLPKDPLSELSTLDPRADRRHERRSLSHEEFGWLVEVAADGGEVQGVCGYDRAMAYLLAAWTGYRRAELASLTMRSFDLECVTPTVTVQARFTRNRQESTIPIHSGLVPEIECWLASKSSIPPDFPVLPLNTPSGRPRRTSAMIQWDLARAREIWLSEAETPEELQARENTDFLCFCDHQGCYADFHSLRHTFVSNLARAGVPQIVTQRLARHSDPRLTANIYTHVDLDDQAASINCLKAPPTPRPRTIAPDRQPREARPHESLAVPMAARLEVRSCPNASKTDAKANGEASDAKMHNSFDSKEFDAECRELSPNGEARPRKFEPLTLGSEHRRHSALKTDAPLRSTTPHKQSTKKASV